MLIIINFKIYIYIYRKMEDANLNSFPKELTKVTSLKEL